MGQMDSLEDEKQSRQSQAQEAKSLEVSTVLGVSAG